MSCELESESGVNKSNTSIDYPVDSYCSAALHNKVSGGVNSICILSKL